MITESNTNPALNYDLTRHTLLLKSLFQPITELLDQGFFNCFEFEDSLSMAI